MHVRFLSLLLKPQNSQYAHTLFISDTSMLSLLASSSIILALSFFIAWMIHLEKKCMTPKSLGPSLHIIVALFFEAKKFMTFSVQSQKKNILVCHWIVV